MPYNLCPCRAASAKAGGNGKGWKGAINFGPSGKQQSRFCYSSHPVFLLVHLSQIKPCYLLLNVITVNEALSNSRLLHHARSMQRSYRNPSSMSQGQKCCQEAWTVSFASSILIKQKHLSKLISECSLLSEVIWWPRRAENPIPWIVKCTFGYLWCDLWYVNR